MAQSLTKKITYNTFFQISGKVGSTVIGLFTIAIITRYLGQAGFGQYTTIMTFLQFFGILVDMGLTLTTAQMISETGADEKKIMSNILSPGQGGYANRFVPGLVPPVLQFHRWWANRKG